jgi:hypothetical protein
MSAIACDLIACGLTIFADRAHERSYGSGAAIWR